MHNGLGNVTDVNVVSTRLTLAKDGNFVILQACLNKAIWPVRIV